MSLIRPNVERLESRGNVGRLIRLLEHKDSEMRFDAMNALKRIGAPAVDDLTERLAKNMKKVKGVWGEVNQKRRKRRLRTLSLLSKILVSISDPRAEEVLCDLLDKCDKDSKWEIFGSNVLFGLGGIYGGASEREKTSMSKLFKKLDEDGEFQDIYMRSILEVFSPSDRNTWMLKPSRDAGMMAGG